MKVFQREISFETGGEPDILDLTRKVENVVSESGITQGIVNISVIGSTAAITTMEYEPGLKEDLPTALERIAPRDAEYKHHLRWGDYNGHSHVRASVLGPSVTLPINGGRIVLGTWQQVIFVELDVRPRKRRVVVTVMGE